jgi:hypothetical protein
MRQNTTSVRSGLARFATEGSRSSHLKWSGEQNITESTVNEARDILPVTTQFGSGLF